MHAELSAADLVLDIEQPLQVVPRVVSPRLEKEHVEASRRDEARQQQQKGGGGGPGHDEKRGRLAADIDVVHLVTESSVSKRSASMSVESTGQYPTEYARSVMLSAATQRKDTISMRGTR